MNKSIIGAAILSAVVILSIFAVVNKPKDNKAANQKTTTDSNLNLITTDEIATHNTGTDCWTHIDDKVYDITEYIPRHPGGDDILLTCGSDGTSLFEQRRTSEGEKVGSGSPHSSNATNQLDQYLKGQLAQ